MSQLIVDLVVEDANWLEELPELGGVAERAAEMALSVLPEARRNAEICVMACNDARIAGLNAQFRDKSKATNVLSWPAFELASATPGGTPALPPGSISADAPVFLGDVAIALETVKYEATKTTKPLKNHALHLILHGTLHLLGYDHETPEDAELMERLETAAFLAEGLPDPYA